MHTARGRRNHRLSRSPAAGAVAGILTTYGEDDLDWMGSHVCRGSAGYYDTLCPSNQIPCWTYNPVRDTEYDPASQRIWRKPRAKIGGRTAPRACERSSSTRRTRPRRGSRA